jgi:hypothetical protein
MAQQTIGLGASANDSTGDPIRTAFGKVNANFAELYAAGLTPPATLDFGTITSDAPALTITGPWNAVGHQFTAPLIVNVTDTASLPGSQLFDLQISGSSKFRVEKDGLVRAPGGIVAGGTFNADYVQTGFGIGLGGDPWSGVFYGNGTSIYSTADGVVVLSNGVTDNFDRLVFGVDSSGGSPAATAAFPALKRSGTTLQARLADDSGDAHLSAGTVTHHGVAFANLPGSPVAGMTACITDSNTNTWGATIAGGGANTVLAWYNGSNWTVTGK